MKNLLKALFLFFLPIFKQAAAQAVVTKVSEYAYPPRTRPQYNQYGIRSDFPRRAPAPGTINYARMQAGMPLAPRKVMDPKYHDVLMLALDITGPNQALVHAFLEGLMPETGEQDNGVNVDSWWIADDDYPHCDTDSAVFVSKGNQAAARKLLRENGLVR